MCIWKKKGSSMRARPRRVDDVFGEGMMGFSERFVCCRKTNKKVFLPKAEKAQLGRLLSGWLSAGYRSKCWQATSQNREPCYKECIDSRREPF